MHFVTDKVSGGFCHIFAFLEMMKRDQEMERKMKMKMHRDKELLITISTRDWLK
jgi:hypothetical protein